VDARNPVVFYLQEALRSFSVHETGVVYFATEVFKAFVIIKKGNIQ